MTKVKQDMIACDSFSPKTRVPKNRDSLLSETLVMD